MDYVTANPAPDAYQPWTAVDSNREQYGSRRVTIRNRKFLRKYAPVQLPATRLTIETDLALDRPSRPLYGSAKSPIQPVIPTPAVQATSPMPAKESTTPAHTVQEPPNTPTGPSAFRSPVDKDLRCRLSFPQAPTSPENQPHGNGSSGNPIGIGNTSPTTVDPVPTPASAQTSPRRSTRSRRSPLWQKDYELDMGSD